MLSLAVHRASLPPLSSQGSGGQKGGKSLRLGRKLPPVHVDMARLSLMSLLQLQLFDRHETRTVNIVFHGRGKGL